MSRENIEQYNQSRIVGDPYNSPVNVTSSGYATETCPICRRPERLEQDHDHATDLCRGRICHGCNVTIGRYDRPVHEINRFLEYLRVWGERHSANPAGFQTYTDYMREMNPNFRKRGRRPRLRRVS